MTQNPAQSRRGQYVLTDALFRFWFRFVCGQGDTYDRAATDAYEGLIEPYLPDAGSPKFEELCRTTVYNLSQPMGDDVSRDLERELKNVRWTPRGGGDVTHEFCLFSRDGFNQSLIEVAEERDTLRLCSIEGVVTAF